MKKLKDTLACLPSIKEEIKKTSMTFLFLDYDGTLTQIKSRPEEAIPGKDLVDLINNFKNERFVITIISGRSLRNLKNLISDIDLEKINLIGSHGSEIQLSSSYARTKTGYETVLQKPRNCQIINTIKHLIIPEANKIKNILIEEKPVSFAIHYRNIPETELPKIKMLIDHIDDLTKRYDFKYLTMKKVIEIMPEELNKGRAISKIMGLYKKTGTGYKDSMVLCIGDDITDEDLFTANRSGINIKVNRSSSLSPDNQDTGADYFLRDPEEVIHFLKSIMS